jgi:nicotinamide-nucleotide amidase
MMNAEIITIGDELLIGQTIDTNSVYLAKKLEEIGIRISRKTAISDSKSDILEMLHSAQQRVDLLIITGGLGPTKDDITKNTLVEYFNCGWRTDQSVFMHLAKIFATRGRALLETNKIQAELPDICVTLHNEVGTAPGMLFNEHKKIVISLPGVPNEVHYLTEFEVLPKLQQFFNLPKVEHRTLVTLMVPESLLSKQLEAFESSLPEDLSLAYLPSYNCVKLRLSCKVLQKSENYLNDYFQKLQKAAAPYVFCIGDETPANFIGNYLIKNNLSIATAESCTGGFIVNQLVQVPGISEILPGSILSYSNSVKHEELNVPQETIHTYGAVSEEVAVAMVDGVCAKFGVNIGIATTGIAGPTGGSPEKPVGLIFIAVRYNEKILVNKFKLHGSRLQFMERANNCAMAMVKEILEIKE